MFLWKSFNKTPKDHSTMITHHSLPKPKIGSCCCCFPWQFGVKKSMAKTVPLEEGLEFANIKPYTKVHSASWKWRSKSKSKSLNNIQINSTLNKPLSQSQSQVSIFTHLINIVKDDFFKILFNYYSIFFMYIFPFSSTDTSLINFNFSMTRVNTRFLCQVQNGNMWCMKRQARGRSRRRIT